MEKNLVIVYWKKHILTAVYENDILCEILLDDPHGGNLGNIYVGRIQNVVKNINAAFVEFERKKCGYYSLSDPDAHFFLNHKKNTKAVPGDELLIQVVKDPVKTKPAMLTGKITLPGQYLVLTAKKPVVSVSAKITDKAEIRRLKAATEPFVTENYGFIVRTGALGQPEEVLGREAKRLGEQFEVLLKRACHSTCFSKLYVGMPAYVKYILDHPDLNKITTDIKDVYDRVSQALKSWERSVPLVFYRDESWPLVKLKSLPTHIQRVLDPKVWLKSGGFLMIQPTEAMVVIDVNTGRYTGKKTTEETYFKVNMEAAAEIARQIRLRNLSGIIVIDFIDMKDSQMRRSLFESFGKFLDRDPVKTVLVDTTRLNLVEMTRKKERKPLYELLGKPCPVCGGWGFVDAGEERDHE